MAKSQEERARRRVCADFDEAEKVLAELGEGNKIYLVSLPEKTFYVVAGVGFWAVGIAAVMEGVLPPAIHITSKEEVDTLLELQNLKRRTKELEQHLKQQRGKK